MITVLGISGSMHWPSHTHTMLEMALGAARDNGARVELLEVRVADLPMFEPRMTAVPHAVTEMRERIADAHAFIVGTPEYHGSLSGALKNLFDYLYPEINGKLFGLTVATGSGQGVSVMSHLHEILTHCYAWSLPYNVTAELADFDESFQLANPRIRERLLRLGRDIAVYGELIHERFTRDRVLGGGVQLGFAPWHARE